MQGIISQRLGVRADGKGRVPAVEMISYETAREAASNLDDFDLKASGTFSAAEMTYETTGKGDDKGSKRESPKPSPLPFFKR